MNQRFYWSPEYETGIKVIDDQHRTFFEIVNSIIDLANSNNYSSVEVLASIGQLGSYASYHLGTEEELFKKYAYPDSASHIETHNQFRKMAQDYINQARQENQDIKRVAEEAANYAGDWLKKHILVIDKKYVPFLKEHLQ